MEEAIQVETLREQLQGASQPAFQPEPKLDEAKVREAMQEAARAGVDPFKLTVGDMETGIRLSEPTVAQVEPPVEVPEKFKKPNGAVDVEKLNDATRQLDAAVQAKEAKTQEVQKSVEDMVREYKALEKRLSSTPNPDRLAAQLPQAQAPQVPQVPQQYSDQQLEAMINADMQANPARTVAQLVQMSIERALGDRLKPIEEDRRDNSIRANITKIAEQDPRILNQQVFDAVNVKLRDNPELWNLKNPHKTAWLEVKEELRLGEPSQVQAQPSKPSAPILGGGTPPPAPSLSDSRVTLQTLDAAITQLHTDPRKGKIDPGQQKALDDAAANFFREQERLRPR